MSTLNYRYDSASTIYKAEDAENLFLSHFREDQKGNSECLFWGQLTDPFIISRCLITLSNIVKSNFTFNPAQLAMLKDPIVTAGNEQIRFEAFSMCAGVYGRVDVLPNGQSGEFIESGTTNVDFNIPLITALSKIQKKDKLVLSVGKKEVGFHKDGQDIIERKVPLPTKWIKGLTTVQHYFAESEYYLEIDKLSAIQLFRSLPKGKIKNDLYLIKRGGRYVFSSIKSNTALCIGGAHRLHLLTPLISLANNLSIYKHVLDQSCNLILHFNHVDFTFALSRNPHRGYSGDGATLENLLGDLPLELIRAFDQYSYANQSFNSIDVALEHDIEISKIENLSAKLAAMGLLGFDIKQNSYFYRRLPFKLIRILSLNPRLKGANSLLENKKVSKVTRIGNKVESMVEGSQGENYYVVIQDKIAKCTCPWYSKNQGERGHCKHILATKKLIYFDK